jgi:Tol biopolymer transport system component
MSNTNDWAPSSWSPDGRKLAGFHGAANQLPLPLMSGRHPGIFVYSFESQQYEKLTDFGIFPVWLSDSRRLLFTRERKLHLIDSQSKKVREVLSVAPNEFRNGVTISRDDRQIYFSLFTTEADIWLMSLE